MKTIRQLVYDLQDAAQNYDRNGKDAEIIMERARKELFRGLMSLGVTPEMESK